MPNSKCEFKCNVRRTHSPANKTFLIRDWKKLTFYYFADSYINFNSLVTDLFKIYKTRIWMSAINPASFVTPPSAGLSAPNPLAYNHDAQADRPLDGRIYGHPRDAMGTGRDIGANQMGMLRNAYVDSYQPFSQASRQPELGGLASVDPFTPYSANNYGSLDSGYVDYGAGTGASPGPSRLHAAPSEWINNRFQGLSLNS